MSRQEKIKDLHFDAVLPCHLLLNQEIESSAKVFYGIVRNLTKVEGYCYAKNDYLSDLMGVDERTIQRWIKSLSEAGYIEVEWENQSFNPDRYIHIVDTFKKYLRSDKNVVPGRQKCRSIDKEDSLKEDSDIDNEQQSSSSLISPPQNEESLKDEMKRKISCPVHIFEEAWKRFLERERKKPGDLRDVEGWLKKVTGSLIRYKDGVLKSEGGSFSEIHKRQSIEHEIASEMARDPIIQIHACNEYVEIVHGNISKIIRYDVSDEEWSEKTGWGYET